jgi:phosphatidylglycerophosphate synthase
MQLKEHLENSGIIDKNFSYPLVNILLEPIYKINLTPHIITTITLILRLISAYLLYNNIYVQSVPILYLISWITDAMDGELARKYNMKSNFGALYDSIVDITTHILIFSILYMKYNKKETFILTIINIIYLHLYVLLRNQY